MTKLNAREVVKLALAQPFSFNRNYRISPEDLRTLLEFAEGVGATGPDLRLWYANGASCEDRDSAIATFHPMIHKMEGEWERICVTAKSMARRLRRWIWLTIGEDRWVRIMVGDDPDQDVEGIGPLFVNGKYQNDQFITTYSPLGEERFVGCS